MELSERNSSRPRIAAACVRKRNKVVGMTTIASHERSLVQGKSMTADDLGLLLLLIFNHNNYLDYSKSSP
jgi:hypothetical protein